MSSDSSRLTSLTALARTAATCVETDLILSCKKRYCDNIRFRWSCFWNFVVRSMRKIQLLRQLLPLDVSSCSTHVPLHSFSARPGSLNERCMSYVLLSHVYLKISGLCLSESTRLQAIWRCFES